MRQRRRSRNPDAPQTLLGVLAFLSMAFSVPIVVAQEMTVSKNGNVIFATISAPSLTGEQCCLGLSLDGPGGASCTQPCPHADWSDSWTCNSVGTHTVIGCWSSSETNYQYACTSETVEILQSEAAQPSPTCPLFDMLAGNRVLTHLYDPNDSYPQGQVQDAQMTITLKARRANPGSTIYLQVTDPPDSASYGGHHSAGDNVDTTTPNVGTINGATQVTTVLPPSGQTSTLVLTTTPYAAGDNYRVVGSTDPQFLTDPSFQCSDCPDTGVITAWKRVYLETDRMFRHGAMVSQDVPAGAMEIPVSSVAGFVAPKGKKPGSAVMIVHAPTVTGAPFYYEPAPGDPPLTVAKINSHKLTIELSRPLLHPYYTTTLATHPWLSDGIGVVTGVDSTDFYTPNTGLISGLYAQAFVEVIPRASADAGYIPYYANFTNASDTDMSEMGAQWFRHHGSPNWISAIGGSKSNLNLGDRLVGQRFAWIWVGEIESLVGSSNRANLNGESTTHEVTHEWDVNGPFNSSGHCLNTFDYQQSGLFCLMRPGSDWFDATGTTVNSQYYDGRVMFHFDVQALDPSEFLDLRYHGEPLQ